MAMTGNLTGMDFEFKQVNGGWGKRLSELLARIEENPELDAVDDEGKYPLDYFETGSR